MDERDLTVRNHVYARFVELGRAPTPDEVGDELGLSPETTRAALRRLHDEHALVLDADGSALLMAAPFSAVPTPHRVLAHGRWWYANCAWDAFGVLSALDVDGLVSSSCADCAEAVEITVRGGTPMDDQHVVHFNVPAAHWWEDIVFT